MDEIGYRMMFSMTCFGRQSCLWYRGIVARSQSCHFRLLPQGCLRDGVTSFNTVDFQIRVFAGLHEQQPEATWLPVSAVPFKSIALAIHTCALSVCDYPYESLISSSPSATLCVDLLVLATARISSGLCEALCNTPIKRQSYRQLSWMNKSLRR
jgi:hypothetical protein